MQIKFILSFDPSGAYKEGKGTTGWTLFSNTCDRAIAVGEIDAHDYESANEYWNAHTDLIDRIIKKLNKQYKDYDLRVVIENYLLYAHKASSQINSTMETSQLLGVFKFYLYHKKIPYRIRPASQVLKRWNNNILLRKGYINKYKGRWALGKQFLNKHMLDSLRHAVHESTFYMNKPCSYKEER